MKKVLIADDHQIFLEGLRLIFSQNKQFQIAKEVFNGQEVLNAFEENFYDFAILDINMAIYNGLETCKILSAKYPICKIIFLTMHSDRQFVNEFLKSIASAYVLKNSGKSELFLALKMADKGEKFISSALQLSSDKLDIDLPKFQSLTKREIDIIKLLVNGKNSQQIAEELFLSIFTVNTHRKNILHKLGLKNTAGIVKFAIDNNIQ